MPPKKGTKRKAVAASKKDADADADAAAADVVVVDDDDDGEKEEIEIPKVTDGIDGEKKTEDGGDGGDEQEQHTTEEKDEKDQTTKTTTVKRQKKSKSPSSKEEKAVDNDEKDGGEDNNSPKTTTTATKKFSEEKKKVRTPPPLEYPTLEQVRGFVPAVTCDHFEAKFRDVEDPQYDQNQLEVFNALIKFPVKSQLQFIEESDSLAALRKTLASHNAKVWLHTKSMVAAEKELDKLPEKVSQALKALYDSNHMKEDALDFRVLSFLAQMKEESALLAIEDLSNQNLDVIKNVSAYFKGVCRRRNDENKDGVQFGSMGGGAGGTQEQGHAYNPALQDVQNALMRGVITPMVGTAMERLFTSNPGVQFDAAAWEEFTQLNEMMAMNCIDETFIELQNARGGVRNPCVTRTACSSQKFESFSDKCGTISVVVMVVGTTQEEVVVVVVEISVVEEEEGTILITTTTTITSEEEEEVAAATAAKAVAATAAKAWTIKRSEVRSQRTRTE